MTAHPFDYAQAQHDHPSRNWSGYCLIFVRTALGVGAKYSTAANAWWGAKHKHVVSEGRGIPRGVPVFWTGGSHGYGHVALSRGDGTCWTTDFVRPGKVDVAHIDQITDGWHLHLAGWSEDLNGVRVYTAPAKPNEKPKPPPTPAKPTRVQRARTLGAQVVEVLNAAVRNGRVGAVKQQRDAIKDALDKLPKK